MSSRPTAPSPSRRNTSVASTSSRPPTRGGWITTTARTRAIDRFRRESRERKLLSATTVLSPGDDDPGVPEEVEPVQDDRLRLIFTCCPPALSTEAQVALTMRLLG